MPKSRNKQTRQKESHYVPKQTKQRESNSAPKITKEVIGVAAIEVDIWCGDLAKETRPDRSHVMKCLLQTSGSCWIECLHLSK